MYFMDNYYVQMKQNIGVDPDYAENPDDPGLDAVFKRLRPNSTARNFREFMAK